MDGGEKMGLLVEDAEKIGGESRKMTKKRKRIER
jgi:hypothetical protein